MFDPSLIPPRIWPAAKVQALNEMIARLEARKVDRIHIPEPDSLFRGSNLIRAFCQAHVRRCLVLLRSAYDLFFVENGLVSLMCIRAIYETVATFLAFERKLQELITEDDLEEIYAFANAQTHATRVPHLIEEIGEKVKATNILTQIEKLNKLRDSIMEEYDFLSDHTHPNGFGGLLFFADLKSERDTAIFSDSGPDPEADLQWILVAADMLNYFEAALIRIEEQLPGLSSKGADRSPYKPTAQS